MATKKVGSAGRLGPRYGRRIRQKITEIEKKLKQWHKCPYCNKRRVRRLAAGIWFCKSCDSKFTGKAYEV
jgi:large subunit ribosomal protein L37Ae